MIRFRFIAVTSYSSLLLVLALVICVKCQDPQPPISLGDKGHPEWHLEVQQYEGLPSDRTIRSDYYSCKRETVIRQVFMQKEQLEVEAYGVPIYWSGFTSIMSKVTPHSTVTTFMEVGIWPEIILPFIFSLIGIVIAILSIIPLIIIGAVGFILLFNMRHLGAKKIRMMIRSMLIKTEKMRRWKYEMTFPRQHLRKFQERDRYQMPQVFQDSDLSSDDEPEELRRLPIPRKITTLWTQEDIEIIGFDPDNLPVETIYGDLLGQPENLDPMIARHLQKRESTTDWRDALGRGSLDSDEWAEVLKQQVARKKKSRERGLLARLHLHKIESTDNKEFEKKKKKKKKKNVQSKPPLSSSKGSSVKKRSQKTVSNRSTPSVKAPPRKQLVKPPPKPRKVSTPSPSKIANPPAIIKKSPPPKPTPLPKKPTLTLSNPKVNTSLSGTSLPKDSTPTSPAKPPVPPVFTEQPTESPPIPKPANARAKKILENVKSIPKNWFNIPKERPVKVVKSSRKRWQ